MMVLHKRLLGEGHQTCLTITLVQTNGTMLHAEAMAHRDGNMRG